MNDKLKSQAFSNLVSALIFIAIGVWAWIQTGKIKTFESASVQPSTFPRIMITGLLIFSVVLLIQSALKLMNMKEGDPLAEKAESINFIKERSVQAALAVIALCVLFVALFRSVGYVLCAAVVSMAIMFLIGKRKWVQMILISVLVPLLMWGVFYKALTVRIPLGPLSFLQTLADMI